MANDNLIADLTKFEDYRLAEFRRPSFSRAEIKCATGLTEKTLQNFFARYGAKMRLSAPAPGKGRSNLYSASDAVLLSAVRALTDFEIPPPTAILLAHHVRTWVVAEARRYYQNGFVHLPDQLFGVLPPLYGGKENLVIQAATVDELWAAAKKRGHRALLVLDGARLARETIDKLWARYQSVRE